MDKEVYSFALKNALTEIRGVCPEVECSFLFDRDGTIITKDAKSSEVSVEGFMKSFEEMSEKASVIGGFKSLVIEGDNKKLIVSPMNSNIHLAMLVDKRADMRYVQAVTNAIIPTMLRLLENLAPAPLKDDTLEKISEKIERKGSQELVAAEPETALEPEAEIPEEPPQIELLPMNQLIVNTFGGLLVRSDTVKIDASILSQWSEMLQGKNINMVEIETFEGKTAQCKVKAIKDSKLVGKGIIEIPEKLSQLLDVKRGELVRVRPVIS